MVQALLKAVEMSVQAVSSKSSTGMIIFWIASTAIVEKVSKAAVPMRIRLETTSPTTGARIRLNPLIIPGIKVSSRYESSGFRPLSHRFCAAAWMPGHTSIAACLICSQAAFQAATLGARRARNASQKLLRRPIRSFKGFWACSKS